MKLKRLAVVGLSLAAASGGAVRAAGADPWGTDTADTGTNPDANPHTFCFLAGNFDANERSLITDTNTVTDANSDMNAQFMATCSANTDVRWDEVDLGMWRGVWDCTDYAGGECSSGLGRLDSNVIAVDNNFGGSFNQGFRKSACHENGHSMGLTHYKDANNDFPNPPDGQHDCMISGDVNDDSTWQVYSAHHKGHINNQAF